MTGSDELCTGSLQSAFICEQPIFGGGDWITDVYDDKVFEVTNPSIGNLP